MPRLRKTLPGDMSERLTSDSFEEIIAILERCEVGARQRNGTSPQILHLNECSDDVIRWAVARGEDVNGQDHYGDTPLHHRVGSRSRQIPLLISLGADVDSRDLDGNTPLIEAARCHNVRSISMLLEAGADPNATSSPRYGSAPHDPLSSCLDNTPAWRLDAVMETVERLLSAGAVPRQTAQKPLRALGKEVERYIVYLSEATDPDPSDFSQEHSREVLNRLYRIFGVAPVQPLRRHDGTSPILLSAGTWEKQYQELWEALVPSQGQASTTQGEAIRIAGRVSNEICGNGGANWNWAYRLLAAQLGEILGSGTPLPRNDLEECLSIITHLHEIQFDQTDRLIQLTIAWVGLNPLPVPNRLPNVGR